VNLLLSNNKAAVTEAIGTSGRLNVPDQPHARPGGAQGLAGRLLSDEQLARNFSELASNLASVTSTLDQRGLWASCGQKHKHDPVTSTNQ